MSKKRIIWILLIVILVGVWINYTWDLIPGTRATMDAAAVYAGGIAGGAFGSIYVAIVTSPFWQTYVSPWAWLISGCIFSIATMIVFWKAPIIRRKAPSTSKKDLGTGSTTIGSSTPIEATTRPEQTVTQITQPPVPPPTTQEKKEGETSA